MHIYHFGGTEVRWNSKFNYLRAPYDFKHKSNTICKFGEQLTSPITIHLNRQFIDPMDCIGTDIVLKLTQISCIGRESNPGRPRGRRAFYHWTTDANDIAFSPSCWKFSCVDLIFQPCIAKASHIECKYSSIIPLRLVQGNLDNFVKEWKFQDLKKACPLTNWRIV